MMGPMSPNTTRGPLAMVTVAVLMAFPAALSLLENKGMTWPAYITSPWLSPKPKGAMACNWLPGTGSMVIVLPVIPSVAVLGVFRKVLGLKVLPPSMLVLNELATRAR